MINYYFCEDGIKIQGPVDEESIKKMIREGALSTTAQLCQEGIPEWRSLGAFFPAEKNRSTPSVKWKYWKEPGTRPTFWDYLIGLLIPWHSVRFDPTSTCRATMIYFTAGMILALCDVGPFRGIFPGMWMVFVFYGMKRLQKISHPEAYARSMVFWKSLPKAIGVGLLVVGVLNWLSERKDRDL